MSTQIIIPGGPFSFQAKTGLSLSGGVHAQEVEDDFLEQREILWCVVLTDGTGIFPHGDIEHPVQLVLDRLVRTYRLCQLERGQMARADVIALFQIRRLALDLTQRVDPCDDRATRPVPFRHDPRCGQHRAALCHDPAVASIQIGDVHDSFLLIRKGILDRLQQTGLIAFDGQQVIGFLAYDLLGNGPLAT